MGDIIGEIKIKECKKRLEELEEGLDLIVSILCGKYFRGEERYILIFENIADCYCSNYWLKKEIEDRKLIKILRLKT